MYDYASRYSMRQPERGKHIAPRVKFGMILPTSFGGKIGAVEEMRGQAAYNVYIKDRVYVKGKKVYPDKYVLASKKPHSEFDAKTLLLNALDKSAAATGYIEPTDEIAQPLNMRLIPWNSIIGKFRQKPDGKYVEKETFRIDSEGEIQDISALGWISKQPKVKREKPTRITREKQPRRDIFESYDSMDKAYTKTQDHFEQAKNQMLKAMGGM